MKLIFLSILMSCLALSSATASAFERSCGPQVLSNIPKFQTALNNLYSLTYVREALDLELRFTPSSELCVSMVAVGNNIYQYQKYFIQIEVVTIGDPDPKRALRTCRFLFQDASVQAFHGYSGQPWTGVNPSEAHLAFQNMVYLAAFKPVKAAANSEPVEIAKASASYQNHQDTIDLSTLAAIEISKMVKAGRGEVFLVTWLSKPESNPFLHPVIASGVLVSRSPSGKWLLGESVSIASDLLFPLEANVTKVSAQLKPDQSDWKLKLMTFSR
jgi:hypothetical protein